MAPTAIRTPMFYEANSAEPVQIIGKSGVQDVPVLPQRTDSLATPQYRWRVVWRNVLIFVYLHIAAVYGLYHVLYTFRWQTLVFGYVWGLLAGLGVTTGAHRLWAHKAYKANFSVRLMLVIFQTAALQNDIHEWVRDHRVHHKFTDTNADPHNSTRGFFFSHMGWLLVKKHKDVILKGKSVDMSDVEADPIVRFQKKYYVILAPLFAFIIPSLIPWYFFNENLLNAWNGSIARYVVGLHFTWLVNSAAHIWGSKPYDRNMNATDNRFVSWAAIGEGWHNYHHVFPWDYKAAELGNYRLNLGTAVIDFMAWMGWAYDLKTVSQEVILKRAKRTGDGTNKRLNKLFGLETNKDVNNNETHISDESVWGWDDKDMTEEDFSMAEIHNRKNRIN